MNAFLDWLNATASAQPPAVPGATAVPAAPSPGAISPRSIPTMVGAGSQLPSQLPFLPTSGQAQGQGFPMPPRRPSGMMAQPQAASQPQAQGQAFPLPPSRPADIVPPAMEWVQEPDPLTGQLVWSQRAVQSPAQGASAPAAATPPGGTGTGLAAFLTGLGGKPAGNPSSVGTTGPQIPAPTGIAAMLGAQPSMQAQQSTGPTAFLDQLFGFRG